MTKKLVTLKIDPIDFERLEELKGLTGRSYSQSWRDGLRLLWQIEMQGIIDANNPNPRPEQKENLR